MVHRKTLAVAAAAGVVAAATAVAVGPAVLAQEPGPSEAEVTLTRLATVGQPTAGTTAPDGSVWIAERAGVIRVLGEQGLGETILDISAEVGLNGEQGLLGMVFDPTFEHFYISFSDLAGDNVIDEFEVSASGELLLGTRRTVFTQEQPFSNHNGGHITFGPDGMFYIGLGDGGSSGDPLDNGQNLGTLLGSILRIDPTGAEPYAIPPDNPFVNDPNARDEIWAYGLRNPWRFSFDAVTNDLWIGDVGQNTREEINFVPAGTGAGRNYGWARMEGTLPFSGQEPANHTPPIFDYDNDGARCAVTGGYVYRGNNIPALQGAYLYSDFCDGTIRALETDNGQVINDIDLGVSGFNVVSFVEGPDREIYVLNTGLPMGSVFRLDPVNPPSTSEPPPTTTEPPPTTTQPPPTTTEPPPSTSEPPPSTSEPPPSTEPPPTTTEPPPAAGCSVNFSANEWGDGNGGFTAGLTVTNQGDPISGWTLEFTLPGSASLTQGWSANWDQNGQLVTATNMSWNANLGQAQIGFNGTGYAGEPTSATLNGTTCSVS